MDNREPIHQKQIELMIVIMIIGILVSIAIPIFSRYRDQALVVHALGEHAIIRQDLFLYHSVNGTWPNDSVELDTFVSGFWGKQNPVERDLSSQLIDTIRIESGAVHYKFKNR